MTGAFLCVTLGARWQAGHPTAALCRSAPRKGGLGALPPTGGLGGLPQMQDAPPRRKRMLCNLRHSRREVAGRTPNRGLVPLRATKGGFGGTSPNGGSGGSPPDAGRAPAPKKNAVQSSSLSARGGRQGNPAQGLGAARPAPVGGWGVGRAQRLPTARLWRAPASRKVAHLLLAWPGDTKRFGRGGCGRIFLIGGGMV